METFDDIIKGDKPVLVDFFATWCGPCKALAPTIEAIGHEVQGKARVLKIDIDKNEALATQYRIQSVPTLMIFSQGESVWRSSGVLDKATITQELEKYF
ncbi:MAG: thioredoxin [Tannerellaceae bacterium]|nr:thioredoxin [Tannerellaceae bacterium]MCD8177005.1 thioredoxin [Tannerellaceae bacterium]